MTGQAHEPARTRPDEVIEHGLVTLRRYRADDLEALHGAAMESLDHLRPWFPWVADYSRQTAAEYLDGSIRSWADGDEYGNGVVWRLLKTRRPNGVT